MNNTTHPIDHAIVLLLIAFEGICWIANELAGFHSPLTAETAEPEIEDPRDTIAIEAPIPFDCSFDGGSHDIDWFEALADLTIRQPVDLSVLKVTELRKKAKGLAKGVHLMRKQELIALLA